MHDAPEIVVKKYEHEGYKNVRIRRDRPHFKYEPHYHPHHVVLHILEGDLTVTMEHHDTTLKPGDRIDIEAERFHTTCVGPEGCVYIHAEKH